MDYALTDASIAQARVWGMDATSPMGSLYVQGTLNVAFGSGDTFVNSDTQTGLRADTLRHTAILDVAQREAVYMTGATTNWSKSSILATHAPSTTATVPIAIFAGTANNKAGTVFNNAAKMKLYRIKFFTDGTLVHDYLPCVKGGVPGLRDQVDGVFVTSENVGALSVGGDVETIEDDPWIALPDNKGYIYLFSSSHGQSRPSRIARSSTRARTPLRGEQGTVMSIRVRRASRRLRAWRAWRCPPAR